MTRFECSLCGWTMLNYRDWKRHLLHESHQLEARKRREHWTEEETNSGVVVFGITNVPFKDVIQYFGNLAFVSDFVFWAERQDFCIIQFLIPEFLENVTSKKHYINGQGLALRFQKDITAAEWVSICPFSGSVVKSEVKNEFEEANGADDSSGCYGFEGENGSSSLLADTAQMISSMSLDHNNSEEEEQFEEPIPTDEEALRLNLRMERCILMNRFSKTFSSSGFINKAQKCSHPKMKEAIATNLNAVWLTLLQDFNNLVWPLCFGVRLLPVSPLPRKSKKLSKVLLNTPFQGVLVQSEKVNGNWLKGRKTRLAFQDRLSELHKRVWQINNSSTECTPNDKGAVPARELIFTCRMDVTFKKCKNAFAEVKMDFINVCGCEITSSNCQSIMWMYSHLWKSYSTQQLLKRKKIRITKAINKLCR